MLHVGQMEASSIFLMDNMLLKACAKLHEKQLPEVMDMAGPFADT